MSIAKRLIQPKENCGQCEAERIWSYYKPYEDAHPDKQCKNGASFDINGKRYCQRHAAIMALKILCNEN